MPINRVMLSGNLTRDPVLRHTQAGAPVLSFSIAINERYKDQKTNEWETRPNFVDCVLFDRRAESISTRLTKGSKIALEGKLRWTQWEHNGHKNSKLEVVIKEIELLTIRKERDTSKLNTDSADLNSEPHQTQLTDMQETMSLYDSDVSF